MIDPLKLALLPRGKALTIRAPASGFTCVICGAAQESYTYRVSLPERAGLACLGCAGDAGWTVR